MRVSRRAAALGALSLAAAPARALAGGLTGDEAWRLARGGTVRRRADLAVDGQDYLGVLAYRQSASPPRAFLAVLSDAREGMHVLPFALGSEEIPTPDADRRFAIQVGGKIAQARFVLRMRYESATLVKFFMDDRYPHDIGDCYGFFRFEPRPEGGSLVTVAGACDVGSIFVKLFLLDAVRENLFRIVERLDDRAALRA